MVAKFLLVTVTHRQRWRVPARPVVSPEPGNFLRICIPGAPALNIGHLAECQSRCHDNSRSSNFHDAGTSHGHQQPPVQGEAQASRCIVPTSAAADDSVPHHDRCHLTDSPRRFQVLSFYLDSVASWLLYFNLDSGSPRASSISLSSSGSWNLTRPANLKFPFLKQLRALQTTWSLAEVHYFESSTCLPKPTSFYGVHNMDLNLKQKTHGTWSVCRCGSVGPQSPTPSPVIVKFEQIPLFRWRGLVANVSVTVVRADGKSCPGLRRHGSNGRVKAGFYSESPASQVVDFTTELPRHFIM